VVQRWLAQRPGGPAPYEADIADTILRGLSTGRRAGADIRIDRLVRNAASPDDAVRQLADLTFSLVADAGRKPADFRNPTNARTPTDDLHGVIDAPGRSQTPSPPALVGILILRQAPADAR
jgi:hypothetical protein